MAIAQKTYNALADVTKVPRSPIFFGTAGWSIARRYDADIPPGESHLHRYARIFNCAEIDTSFYRHHKQSTYARWAASVGEDFRFSVKVPRELTHEGQLAFRDVSTVETFATEISGLGKTLRAVLVQTPPALEFVAADVRKFFKLLRRFLAPEVSIVCEPRHSTWSSDQADRLLASLRSAAWQRTRRDGPGIVTREAIGRSATGGCTDRRALTTPRTPHSRSIS